jgi:hypothetical protein
MNIFAFSKQNLEKAKKIRPAYSGGGGRAPQAGIFIRKSEARFPDNSHVTFSLSSVLFRGFRVKCPGAFDTGYPGKTYQDFFVFLLKRLMPAPMTPLPRPMRSRVAGSGTGFGPLIKLSLPPLAKPCTWTPIRNIPSYGS